MMMFENPKTHFFMGSRSFASNSGTICTEAIEQLILAPTSSVVKKSNTIEAFQTKNNLWNKILSTKDFEQFDEELYFRSLEIYTNEKELTLLTPSSTEEKMALIEVIQNRYAYFAGVPSLQQELATLNSKQLKKIFSLMKSFDPSSQVTREDLESFSSELFVILKGPPVGLLEYFTENKTALMNKRLYRIVQEELLIKGLKSIVSQFPEKTRYTILEKARLHINRIVRFKLWRLASLPLDLPFIDQVKLPDELLEKILFDGIDEHSEELVTIFQKQHMIDNYERLRKAYRTIAYAAAFSYFYEENLENIDKNAEKQKQDFMENFRKLSKVITDETAVTEKSKRKLQDEQFKRFLDKFRAKYHEDPTPQEYKDIKKKIYGN
jgi:hypothetical protein